VSAPDPGGNFASDTHRRTMAHLPNPDDDPLSVDDLVELRIGRDQHFPKFDGADEIAEVLKDLEADGHAKKLKHGWKNTADGFTVLTGPPDESATGEGLEAATLSSNEGAN
jgi:hypothetical protein